MHFNHTLALFDEQIGLQALNGLVGKELLAPVDACGRVGEYFEAAR
jgi:hypothetical protein